VPLGSCSGDTSLSILKRKITVLEEKTQNPSTPTLDLDLSKLMQKRTALSFSCVTSRRSVHLGHD